MGFLKKIRMEWITRAFTTDSIRSLNNQIREIDSKAERFSLSKARSAINGAIEHRNFMVYLIPLRNYARKFSLGSKDPRIQNLYDRMKNICMDIDLKITDLEKMKNEKVKISDEERNELINKLTVMIFGNIEEQPQEETMRGAA